MQYFSIDSCNSWCILDNIRAIPAESSRIPRIFVTRSYPYRYCIVERHKLDNKFTKFLESLNLSIRGYSCDSWSVWNRGISELESYTCISKGRVSSVKVNSVDSDQTNYKAVRSGSKRFAKVHLAKCAKSTAGQTDPSPSPIHNINTCSQSVQCRFATLALRQRDTGSSAGSNIIFCIDRR